MTSIVTECSRRSPNSEDFYVKRPGALNKVLFVCSSGLSRHWNLKGAKNIEIRFHDQKPTQDAHRFRTTGHGHHGICIKPEAGETWTESFHGTYGTFAAKMQQFAREANTRDGWMEVRILDE